MARTVGPLMSMEASGSIAKTLTFSKWKGRPYVRSLVTPANPRSPLQVSTRAMMRFLSQEWSNWLDPTNQASWAALAAAGAFSPFNAYVQHNLRRWTQFKSPTIEYPADEVGTPPTWTALPSVTGGVKQATISYDVNAANDAWGLLIFRYAVTATPTSRDNLVRVVELGTAAAEAIDTPIEPGTYFWNFRSFTIDGVMSAALGEDTAVVT